MRTSYILASVVMLGGAVVTPRLAAADDDWRERRDQRRYADDHFDYARLQELLGRFDQARARNHYSMLTGIERELVRLIDDEIRESERELQREQREAARAQQAGTRRVVVISDNGRPRLVRTPSTDRKESRDAWREARQLDQKRAIAMELRAVAGRQDPAALDYRRARIVRLLELGGRELNGDQRQQQYREQNEPRRDDGWYRR